LSFYLHIFCFFTSFHYCLVFFIPIKKADKIVILPAGVRGETSSTLSSAKFPPALSQSAQGQLLSAPGTCL
jgi:hypothetical protein